MTWKTEKQKVKDILSFHLKEDAPDLCMRYFESVKSFDSVGQGESFLPDIASAFTDLLMTYPNNKFMREHHSYLSAIAIQGFVAWSSAVNGIKSKDMNGVSDNEKMQFLMARRQFHEFACACSDIQGADTTKLREELNKLGVL